MAAETTPQTPNTPADETIELPLDDFGAAFASFAEGDTAKPATPAAATSPEAPAKEEPAKEEPAKEEPAKASGSEEPAKEVEDKPVEKTADQSAAELLDSLTRLARDRATEPSREELPPTEAPAIYTPEEAAALSVYEQEWPEVAKGEALARRRDMAQLLDFVLQQVQRRYEPVAEVVAALAERTQLHDLQQELGDYPPNLREDVEAWIETQPQYLRPAFRYAIDKGTPEEVKHLVTSFEQSTGKQVIRRPAAATTPTSASAPSSPRTELPPSTQKAVEALAPVSSRRTTVPQGQPAGFDDAFAAFAAQQTL